MIITKFYMCTKLEHGKPKTKAKASTRTTAAQKPNY